MLFDSWTNLQHTLIIGVFAYAALVFLLRASGKRTLAKWNMFDFVVTIALGSTLATALLSKDTSLLQGILAFGLLIVLQYAITWLSVRFVWVARLVKAQPTLLLYRGRLRTEALQRERVTESEVLAALRAHGLAAVEQAEAVVLETDGSFSVIKQSEGAAASTLADVKGYTGADPAG